MAVQKPGRELSPGSELAAAPNPGPLTSRTVRNTVLLLEPPSLCSFVMAAGAD